MKKLNETCKYVFDKYPHSTKSNTEACIAVWEEVAKRKGVMMCRWSDMKDIMRSKGLSPEYITRQRRYYCQSTKEQQEKADDYRKSYSTSWK